MPLSVEGLHEIKAAIAAKGGHLTILMDRNASELDAEKWIALGKVEVTDRLPFASQELLARDIGLHYPVLYLYKDGFLSNREYLGFKTKEVYLQWIRLELESISKDQL